MTTNRYLTKPWTQFTAFSFKNLMPFTTIYQYATPLKQPQFLHQQSSSQWFLVNFQSRFLWAFDWSRLHYTNFSEAFLSFSKIPQGLLCVLKFQAVSRPTLYLRPARVSRLSCVSRRACSNMADNEEAVVFAFTNLVFCARDLHQSQEQLLEKVRWTCPLQSTLWRRPWTRGVRVALVVTSVSRSAVRQARHNFFLWIKCMGYIACRVTQQVELGLNLPAATRTVSNSSDFCSSFGPTHDTLRRPVLSSFRISFGTHPISIRTPSRSIALTTSDAISCQYHSNSNRVASLTSGRTSDLWSRGRGFESHPLRCRVRPWASHSRTPTSVTKQYILVLVEGGGGDCRLYCAFEKYVAVWKVKVMRKLTMLRVGNTYNKPL